MAKTNTEDRSYFDSAIAHEYMMEWKAGAKEPNRKLLDMVAELFKRLTSKANYVNYPPELKEDMVSFAWYEFLKYGRNYNPDKIKSKNGVFTFITFNAENSFKRVLKDYYKTKNLDNAMLSDIGLCEEWHENYAYKLSNQLDCDADRNEKLDSWSHDELDSMR